MLIKSPTGHDEYSHQKENSCCSGMSSENEIKPLVNLGRVVGTCNKVEEETTWNLIPSRAIRVSKIPQENVTVKFCGLTNQTTPETHLYPKVTTDRCVQRMFDVVNNVSSKGPVVSTAPEHNGYW